MLDHQVRSGRFGSPSRVGSQVKNPDPVPSLKYTQPAQTREEFGTIEPLSHTLPSCSVHASKPKNRLQSKCNTGNRRCRQ